MNEFDEAFEEGRAGNKWNSEMLNRHPDWTGTPAGHAAINGFEAGYARFIERRDRDARIDAELARGFTVDLDVNETPDNLVR